MNSRPRLSVSTWSLHRTLGQPDFVPAGSREIHVQSHGRGACSLLELPQRVREFGIATLELCCFHLPSYEEPYLDELRASLEKSGVELWSFLIDDGDITHPETGVRDAQWILDWVPVAARLGARNIRVIAGKQPPTPATLELSRQRLSQIAVTAAANNVGTLTENWFELAAQPQELLWLLDQLAGQVGLCFDFGNWNGPNKYERLTQIAPRATSCHTKAAFAPDGTMDQADYLKCLEITRAAHFTGPYTLIFDGPGDEWEGLNREREVVKPFLAA